VSTVARRQRKKVRGFLWSGIGARTTASTASAACWLRKLGGRLPTRKLIEGGYTLSVEVNKAAVRRFFEEVFNEKQPELIKELVTDEVVDHKRSFSPSPTPPAAWRRASGCCS
jgi:hypothetical protein